MVPPAAGSSVMITVDAPGGSSAEPSQPQVNTTRRPGSTSVKVPAAEFPGMTVHRYSPPARRSTRAVITCQRQPVRLGDQGEGLVGVERDEDRFLERHRCLLLGQRSR